MMTRAASPQDRRHLLAITRAAFPEEDLRPIVESLLGRDDVTCLVAGPPGDPVAYAFFTDCEIVPEEGGASEASERRAALLGPLAVAPHHQRQGIGAALVREGLRRLAATGAPTVLVLGDPGYYGRFGFAPTTIRPPYDLPLGWEPAWQALAFEGRSVPDGALRVPEPWQDAALWQS